MWMWCGGYIQPTTKLPKPRPDQDWTARTAKHSTETETKPQRQQATPHQPTARAAAQCFSLTRGDWLYCVQCGKPASCRVTPLFQEYYTQYIQLNPPVLRMPKLYPRCPLPITWPTYLQHTHTLFLSLCAFQPYHTATSTAVVHCSLKLFPMERCCTCTSEFARSNSSSTYIRSVSKSGEIKNLEEKKVLSQVATIILYDVALFIKSIIVKVPMGLRGSWFV